jgi:hypothetical protein
VVPLVQRIAVEAQSALVGSFMRRLPDIIAAVSRGEDPDTRGRMMGVVSSLAEGFSGFFRPDENPRRDENP